MPADRFSTGHALTIQFAIFSPSHLENYLKSFEYGEKYHDAPPS